MKTSLKDFLTNNPNAKTAIIDNNFLAFCTKLKENNVSVINILKQYDVIIVPSWVNVEINDSPIRTAYLQELRDNRVYVYIINETEYIDLADSEELNLLKIVLYSAHRFGQIIGYINKEIILNQPYEDIEYEFIEWINMLYDNWPIAGKEVGSFNNRRIQKKNAGEISASTLAHILSYYFPTLKSITLLTFDTDCFNCIKYAEDKFSKDENFKNKDYSSITFKSNDLILYELVKNNHYSINYIETIINNVRTQRTLKYTRKRNDNSFEDKRLNIDNSTLIEIICDDNLHIIF